MTLRLPMFALALLTTAAPALAQDAGDLPTRPIPRAEVSAVIVRQFKAMDANHDGAVSEAEFSAYRAHQPAAQRGLGAFEHVGSHWFERADADGNGRVTLAEAQTRPLHLFDMADVNHDGVVSVGEAKTAMMLMSFMK